LLTALVLVGTSAGPVSAAPPPIRDDAGLRGFFRDRWPHFFAGPDKHWEVFERLRLPDDAFEHLFDDGRPHAALGGGAMCLDYSAGKRHRERLDGVRPGAFRTRLAALRWPERLLVFGDGASAAVR
jgi:hypothetical protein